MKVFYELSDLRSGNVMANYSREEDAWLALAEIARDQGLDQINELALLRFEDGHPVLVAMDEQLVFRALDLMRVCEGDESLPPAADEVA